MEQAWREYLGPLEERFPDHPYQEEVAAFKAKLETTRNPVTGEAQRFFQLGERLRKDGNDAAALRVWKSLVAAFDGIDADKVWVRQAPGVSELEKQAVKGDRLKHVRPALDRAQALAQAGRRDEAEKVWAALEELYRHDFAGAEVLEEVRRAREVTGERGALARFIF